MRTEFSPPVERPRITAEAFFALPEYDQHTMIQLIDGAVIINMAPLVKHQDLVGEIFFVLKTLSREKGGRVFVAPTEVLLDSANVYEPDVLYLTPDSACVVETKRLVGAPDLVVEVLSPHTARYDRGAKFTAYARAGVREYWIVDPLNRTLEVFSQATGDDFARVGVYGDDDRFTSPLLSHVVELSAILPPDPDAAPPAPDADSQPQTPPTTEA